MTGFNSTKYSRKGYYISALKKHVLRLLEDMNEAANFFFMNSTIIQNNLKIKVITKRKIDLSASKNCFVPEDSNIIKNN